MLGKHGAFNIMSRRSRDIFFQFLFATRYRSLESKALSMGSETSESPAFEYAAGAFAKLNI
jgi:hypothetical protein